MKRASPPPAAAWMSEALREGFDHLSNGRLNEASDCCRRVLSAKPDLVEGHFLVGLVAMELGQPRHAIHAFGSVTKLKPDHPAAWANLAKLFNNAGQVARAENALTQAVQHNDGNTVVMDLIATIYGQLSDHEEAAKWLDRALESNPASIPALVNRANNHIFFDQISEADTLLQRVFEKAPEHPNAHWLLSTMRKARDRRHIEEMEACVARDRQGPRALAFLYYGLGKEFEDLEDWDNAFDAFAKGAANRRKTIGFDESNEVATYGAFESTFTEAWMAAGALGNESTAPIFVVGQPRTGTTLIERVITAHSEVHSAGELRQFGQCVRRLGDYRGDKMYSPAIAEIGGRLDPERLGSAYLAATKKFQGNTPRFVDKLPPNYLYIPLILKALPRAKIIHLRRGPMDACFASFKQLFADAYPHSYDQEEMARHHARYFHLMQVWRERFPGRFLDVSYEEAASNLEPNARAMIEYLELPWEDACLEFYSQGNAVTTASSVQVREPAHTRSVDRWKRYETQLKPMQQALNAAGVPLEF